MGNNKCDLYIHCNITAHLFWAYRHYLSSQGVFSKQKAVLHWVILWQWISPLELAAMPCGKVIWLIHTHILAHLSIPLLFYSFTMPSNYNNGKHDPAQSPPPARINYDSLTTEIVFQTSTNPTNHTKSPSTSSSATEPSRESQTTNGDHGDRMDLVNPGDGMDLVDPGDGMEFHSMVPYALQEEASNNHQYSWKTIDSLRRSVATPRSSNGLVGFQVHFYDTRILW